MPTMTAWEFKFPVPDTNDAYRDLLANPDAMATMADAWGEDTVPNLSQHFAAAKAARDNGADQAEEDEQMAAQMTAEFREMGEANNRDTIGELNPRALAQLQAIFDAQANRPARPAAYNPAAPGVALDRVWPTASAMLRSVLAADRPGDVNGWADRADLTASASQAMRIQAAYSSHIGEDGGFLVPEQFRATLLQIALEESLVRPRATVIPMSTAKVTIPAIHETSRATTLFGGIQMYWTAEEAAASASSAKFSTISLEPSTLTGYATIPMELLADAIATDAFFMASFPPAMAYETDYEFIQGNGVGKPQGWLNADCAVAVAKETGQAADTVVVENVANMWARLPASSMARAVWVINQEVIPQLLTMSDASGNQPIWAMNIANGAPGTILGRPVIVTEKVNALGDQGDINLVDLSYYLIGDRQSMTVTTSDHYRFPNRERAFLITERVDGRAWLKSAVTPRKGANTLSPFVTLAARA